ncbi:hypothetical protein [Ancylobacter amanitiformis]|uniref:hypothetical protein n=1 Tax=Ancylobacter amanitiformis TaxID=217069 RepID=UPI0027D84BF3|nr:hypothetical protein [Ancylobacter amanitiformis]
MKYLFRLESASTELVMRQVVHRLSDIESGGDHRRDRDREHFRAKWIPVRAKKMRQTKNLELFR